MQKIFSYLPGILLFLTLFLVQLIPVSAQLFVDINAGLLGLNNSAAAWGDYDNDYNPDLVIAGTTSSGLAVTKIYNNSNGIFTALNITLPGLKNGSVAWGDFNNNGYLDILATGENAEQKTFIFKNNGSLFEVIDPGFAYYGAFSSGCWADYNNDGFQDVFLTGSWKTTIYKNNGDGTFTDSGIALPMLSSGRAAWGDLDCDGDLDLLLTGDTGSGPALYIFINNNGDFQEIELPNMGLSAGSIELGDYNSDGLPDILIMGFNSNFEPEANIYRNDGNLTFTNIYAGLAPVALGRAAWGDLDNDGDLDLVLSGKLAGCGAIVTEVYINIGNDYFDNLTAGLTNAEHSFVALGDFDNDTDLDILLMGNDYNGNSFTRIYRNDMSLPNFIPSPPQNLQVQMMEDHVMLTWDKGSDVQTHQNGLSYNIMIGTASQTHNTLSPMSHLSDGFRKITASGNITQSTLWRIYGLENGSTYYWSVQALDNTYAGSVFADEMVFTVLLTNLQEPEGNIRHNFLLPNPSNGNIRIESIDQSILSFDIFNFSGQKISHWTRNQGPENFILEGVPSGVYLIHFNQNGEPVTQKLVVR
jgi:hypothetical protein